IEMAKAGGVKKLILTHHDPVKSDTILGEIEKKLRSANPGLDVVFSREGMEIPL
ncbi:MAG: MBL fold metallo-hydrolase, partial [Deltaproteobacteria bacterium]|nr:MBL fold metallo-hydrolase [Deltaproteobacteria bacterium]